MCCVLPQDQGKGNVSFQARLEEANTEKENLKDVGSFLAFPEWYYCMISNDNL
jgi:hypothetical protein